MDEPTRDADDGGAAGSDRRPRAREAWPAPALRRRGPPHDPGPDPFGQGRRGDHPQPAHRRALDPVHRSERRECARHGPPALCIGPGVDTRSLRRHRPTLCRLQSAGRDRPGLARRDRGRRDLGRGPGQRPAGPSRRGALERGGQGAARRHDPACRRRGSWGAADPGHGARAAHPAAGHLLRSARAHAGEPGRARPRGAGPPIGMWARASARLRASSPRHSGTRTSSTARA